MLCTFQTTRSKPSSRTGVGLLGSNSKVDAIGNQCLPGDYKSLQKPSITKNHILHATRSYFPESQKEKKAPQTTTTHNFAGVLPKRFLKLAKLVSPCDFSENKRHRSVNLNTSSSHADSGGISPWSHGFEHFTCLWVHITPEARPQVSSLCQFLKWHKGYGRKIHWFGAYLQPGFAVWSVDILYLQPNSLMFIFCSWHVACLFEFSQYTLL